MVEAIELADLLGQYVNRSGYTPGQLARLSNVPKGTIVNWLEGRVKKPRNRESLIHIAQALRLNEHEINCLLQVGGYQPTLTSADEAVYENTLYQNKEEKKNAPFQVISDLPYFVGRQHALQTILNTLGNSSPVGICTIHGMGGVGKTVLAAHAAYLYRSRFPDGVLWARLDTSDTMSILNAFASAYGRDVSQNTDIESRSQVVRELLASKRALIVLDNAQSSQEIRPLLPPTGSCAVLITTRRHDLWVTRGTQTLYLREFDKETGESLTLFAQILGAERVQQEKEMLCELAELVGHLPLAVDIIASRLAHEPGWKTADFLRRLRQEKRRLSELSYDDQDVYLSLNLSYEVLSPTQQQFFAVLGMFDSKDFDPQAVSAITRSDEEDTADNLRKLYNLSLLQLGRPGRYRLHPLLSEYARKKLQDETLWERMVQYFLQYAEQHQHHYKLLDVEGDHILAALQIAHKRGMEQVYVQGVLAFFRFLQSRGMYTLAETHLQEAHQISKRLNYTVGIAKTFQYLGQIKDKRGDYQSAASLYLDGLNLARQINDTEVVVSILINIGGLAGKQGNWVDAETHLQEGLSLATQIQNSGNMSALLANLGGVAANRGDYDQAEKFFLRGLEFSRQSEDKERTSILLTNMGEVAQRRGNLVKAEYFYQQALPLVQELGHLSLVSVLLQKLGNIAETHKQYGQAKSFYQEGLQLVIESSNNERISFLLAALGSVIAKEGHQDEQARAYLQQGLRIARQISSQWHVCIALNEWGEFCLNRQRLEEAQNAFQETLELAQKLGFQEFVALALYGLARVVWANGNRGAAHQQARESLKIFTALGHGKLLEVKEWLNQLTE